MKIWKSLQLKELVKEFDSRFITIYLKTNQQDENIVILEKHLLRQT